VEVGFKTGDQVRKTGTRTVGTVERVRIETCVRQSRSMKLSRERNRHRAMGYGTLSHFVPRAGKALMSCCFSRTVVSNCIATG